MRPRNFIQNNSTLFRCFTLLKLLHRWTIFIFIHTKKEFINRATLNLSARWNRKFVHYPRTREKKGIADRCRRISSKFIQHVGHILSKFWSYAFGSETSEHDGLFVHKKLQIYEIQIDEMIISLSLVGRSLLVCMNSFHRHYKIPTKKAEILLFRVSGFFSFNFFFHRERTNSKILWVGEFFIWREL